MNTPDDITRLPANHVFVFGSNAQGFHAGGAAAVAVERFGAVWGQGEGLIWKEASRTAELDAVIVSRAQLSAAVADRALPPEDRGNR